MKKQTTQFSILIIPIIIIFFNILILLFPKDIVSASKDGLSLWFNNVLPSLLPFIIGTNILTSLGVVSFIGTLLEPIMKPLFGVNGAGGFALITGMTSGYPMGAKTVAELRNKNEITQIEAQRLISFTNNSGPLFIIGAVGIGMFHSAAVGYFIILVHYTSAIATGLLFKYYKYEKESTYSSNTNIFKKAFKNMQDSKQKDTRAFGNIMGDSIKNAMETILLIGGFIILFSVIVKILEVTNALYLIRSIFINNIYSINLDENIFNGIFVGLIEVTNGTKMLSESPYSKIQLLAICAIISFGGFSIHAQTLSFTTKTDINSAIYIVSKFIHASISIILGFLIYPFFNFDVITTASITTQSNLIVLNRLAFSTVAFILSISILFIVSIMFNLFEFLYKKSR